MSTRSAGSSFEFPWQHDRAPRIPHRNNQRNVVLYFLVAIPSVLLIGGMLLYWKDVTHRPVPGGRSDTNSSAVEIPDAKPDDLEVAEFRKSVTKLLAASHTFIQAIKRGYETQDLNIEHDAVEYGIALSEIRSRVRLPPVGMISREKINEQFDEMVKSFVAGIRPIKNPEKLESGTSFQKIVERLESIDEHRLPEGTVQAFRKVETIADSIAVEMKLSFDEAHFSHRFRDDALDLVSKSRKSIASLKLESPPSANQIFAFPRHVGFQRRL